MQLSLDYVKLLDAEGFARSHDRGAVVRIVRSIEGDGHASETILRDLAQSLLACIGDERLERTDHVLGVVGLRLRNALGEELIAPNCLERTPSHLYIFENTKVFARSPKES